jgi:type IV pilus assembly protein PilY1
MNKNKLYVALSIAIGATGFTAIAEGLNLPNYPLQTTGFVEPNVMFLLDSSGSMSSPDLSGTGTRLDVAKRVAIDIIKETEDVRFCLSTFNDNQGGRVVSECKLPVQSNGSLPIEDDINSLNASGWTPLAEAYYEVVGYFRDGKSIYGNNTAGRKSPIEWRCQKNYSIVLTDGLPIYDSYFPNLKNDLGYTDVRGNYDRVANDGYYGGPYYSYGPYYYLDDIAKLAYETDLRPDPDNNIFDLAGKSFDDNLFSKQNMHTYTVGFTLSNVTALQMLKDAAEKDGYGHGVYYEASDYEDLKSSFSKALTQITDTSQSVAASSSNSSELIGGSRLYQTRYAAKDWSGELIALDIDQNTFQISDDLAWTASFNSNTSQRVVYTGHSDGVPFQSNFFSSSQITDYFGNANIIDYIKGREISGYRARASSSGVVPLGDIVNSSPIYLEPPQEDVYEDDEFTKPYSAFVEKYKDRGDMIYVGANDGMLHGFDTATGVEKMAFIPEQLLPKLKKLADEDYTHQYFVDGTPTIQDVFIDSKWRTVLVGGLGKGGQGLYALDITEGSFANSEVGAKSTFMWQFTDTDEADLGYTFSPPKIMRLNDGKFYAVVSSGYNNSVASDSSDTSISATGNAVILLIDLETGQLARKLSTNVGTKTLAGVDSVNGLAEVSGIDVNKDNKIDYLYAGDLFGNLWKFDVSSNNDDDWSTASIFKAIDDQGNAQPITASIVPVYLKDRSLVMLLFGTGKYLEASDAASDNISLQTFYGIKDEYQKTASTVLSRADLLEQNITFEGDVTFYSGTDSITEEIRLTTAKGYSNTAESGWFIDLKTPTYTSDKLFSEYDDSVVYEEKGEQVVVSAAYRTNYNGHEVVGDGRVFFVSNIANDSDKCLPSSTSFLTQLDAYTGSRLSYVAVDMNGDLAVDDDDGVTVQDKDGNDVVINASSYSTDSLNTPVFLNVGDSNVEVLIDTNQACTKGVDCGFGDTRVGLRGEQKLIGSRTQWREIRSN